MKRSILSVSIFSLFIILYSLFTTPAHADSPSITVSPSIVRLDLATDQPTADFIYKNNSKTTVEIDFSSQDFAGLEDGASVKFLEEKDAKNYKYSLSSWITFDKKTLVIEEGREDSVKVSINQSRLSPGGHYASIIAEIKALNNDKKNVQINGILSSLLFVRQSTGNVKEEAKIDEFQPIRNYFWLAPQSMLLRFENSGNVDLTPYGLIEVKDILGNTVAAGILNEGSLVTLPETIRRYDIPLKKTAFSLLPGIYSSKITLHFGKSNKYITSNTTFISEGDIPWVVIIPVVLIVVGAVTRRRKREANN